MKNKKLFKKIDLIFLALFLFSDLSLAQGGAEAAEWEAKDLSGLRLEILKPSQIMETQMRDLLKKPPEFPRDLEVFPVAQPEEKNWLPWDPTGRNNFLTSKDCSQESLRERLWRNTSSADQGSAVNDWVHRCQKEIAGPFAKYSYAPLIKYATVAYDFLANPNILGVRATLPDGRVLTGFIAMKPDSKPRPFVIAKCGIFCNGEQSTTHRSFMMHLFDESPFHVLALSSNTGSDFQIENKAFSAGGFDEGRQLYQIAQLVRSPDSPIRERISSVHVVGASLGGSATLFAGLYSSVNDSPHQEAIQSVTATCPVVVLETSAKSLFSAQPISTFASFETIHQIRGIYSFVPVLGRFFPSDPRWLNGKEIYKKLTKAVVAYYHGWTTKTPWDLKPFKGVHIDSLDQYWRLNDFRNYISQVRVPTLTIAAENDKFVKVTDNTKLLDQALQRLPNKNVGNIFFKQGNHCAFAEANGWGNYSMILREYILTHSPEAKDHWKAIRVPLRNQEIDLDSRERIVETSWEARAGEGSLRLKFKIFTEPRFLDIYACFAYKYLKPSTHCYRDVVVKVPIRSLPLDFSGIPKSKYEVTSLTRIANTNFSVVDENGDLVVNSNHTPKYVKVRFWR
jgi:predicted alpha/beta-fold hydrolase